MPPAETADSFHGVPTSCEYHCVLSEVPFGMSLWQEKILATLPDFMYPSGGAEGVEATKKRYKDPATQQSTAQLHHFLCSKDQNSCLSHPFLVKLGMACGLWFTQQPRHLKRFLMCLSWNEWYAPDILDSLQNVYFNFLKWGGPWNKSFNIFSEPPRHEEWLDIGSPCFALLKRRPPAEPLRTFGRSQLCSPHGISSLPALENDDFW